MFEINVCIPFTGKNSWYQVWGDWTVGLGGSWFCGELRNWRTLQSSIQCLCLAEGNSWRAAQLRAISCQYSKPPGNECSKVLFLLVDFRFHIDLGVWIVMSTYLQKYSWLSVFYMDLSFCKGWLLSHFLSLEKDSPKPQELLTFSVVLTLQLGFWCVFWHHRIHFLRIVLSLYNFIFNFS